MKSIVLIFKTIEVRLLKVLLFYILWLPTFLGAYDGTLTYEKYIRLNKPAYYSSSGDWLELSYKGGVPNDTKRIATFAKADVRLYFQDNNAVNYSLQEAYIRFLGHQLFPNFFKSDFKLYFGRKILDWNMNEKYWMLGFLNGNQGFTLLGEEQEGLTGLLLQSKFGEYEIDFFMSYFFIPELNPSVKFENGNVESHSEWTRLPPRSTIISNVETPIFYQIGNVNYSKIIFNKSLGFNIRKPFYNGHLSFFAIYKPENKLRVNAEVYWDNVYLNKVLATANPTVNHHAYAGIQITQKIDQVSLRGGLSYVDPNAKIGKDIPLYSIKNSRQSFDSPYFKVSPAYNREAYTHLNTEYTLDKFNFSLNYIHLVTGNVRSSDDFFSDTVKWKRAFGGRVTYTMNDAFSAFLDLKYDINRYDNIIKAELKYNYLKKIYVSLGLEMLKAPNDASYWSYYRADDTMYTSLGFYF